MKHYLRSEMTKMRSESRRKESIDVDVKHGQYSLFTLVTAEHSYLFVDKSFWMYVTSLSVFVKIGYVEKGPKI